METTAQLKKTYWKINLLIQIRFCCSCDFCLIFRSWKKKLRKYERKNNGKSPYRTHFVTSSQWTNTIQMYLHMSTNKQAKRIKCLYHAFSMHIECFRSNQLVSGLSHTFKTVSLAFNVVVLCVGCCFSFLSSFTLTTYIHVQRKQTHMHTNEQRNKCEAKTIYIKSTRPTIFLRVIHLSA